MTGSSFENMITMTGFKDKTIVKGFKDGLNTIYDANMFSYIVISFYSNEINH